MKQIQKLGLHSHVLPALSRLAAKEPAEHDTFYTSQFEDLRAAVVFDCRRLPLSFVRDTGNAELHEAEALMRPIRLPFPICYFEFDLHDDEPDPDDGYDGSGLGILAMEVNEHGTDPDGEVVATTVEFWVYSAWEIWDELGEEYALGAGLGKFPNGAAYGDGEDEGPPPFYYPINAENPATEATLEIERATLLGTLALLNEHLVATEFQPDPQQSWNAVRAKKGRPPLSCDTRVLTINTAAVRRATNRAPTGTHESPRLHWRRGHHRVLHRGSEFESRTWVKKCLVGNPERGAVHKDYRLTWQLPMLQQP